MAEQTAGVEFPEEDAHVAAEVVIESLGYNADVDAPDANVREDVFLQEAPGTDGWRVEIPDADPEDVFPSDDPRFIQDETVGAHPTAAFLEGEDSDGDGFDFFADNEGNDGAWSGNSAVRIQAGDTQHFEWEPDYEIPEGEAWFEMVFATPVDDPEAETPSLTISIDVADGPDAVLQQVNEGVFVEADDEFDLSAFDTVLNGGSSDFNGPLPSGTHTVSVTSNSGGDLYVDFVHFRDDRFEYDRDDTAPVDEVVQGWQSYPPTQAVVFEPQETSIEQVVGATLDVTMDDTSGGQSLGLRNDEAQAFETTSNALTHTVAFDEGTLVAQARVTLSRYDDGSGLSGSFGSEFQTLESLALFADLANVPTLLNFHRTGSGKEILNEIADAGDFVWEVRRVDGELTIIFTQPGQRVSDVSFEIVDYSVRRSTGESYQHVIVSGSSERVTGEPWSFSDYGVFGLLDEAPVVHGSETVYDAGDRETQYDRLIDYDVDHRVGAIKPLEGGRMDPEAEYEVDYSWRIEGEYTDPGADDPDTRREEFPSATSERECEEIAAALVRELSDPTIEATVQVASVDPDIALTDALDIDGLPASKPLRVKEVDDQPGAVTLQLGTRQSVGDVISSIKDQLQAAERMR